MTNGDAIRAMSNEELFDNYLFFITCADCDVDNMARCDICRSGERYKNDKCREKWLAWLRKEAAL